jgi:MFS transporter, NNP family, nitrate/nitrite transporter
MTLAGFRKAGHTPTLIASFLYFDVSFMVWVILGPLGPFLGEALKLSASQKGFLVALPLLAGSAFRPLLGYLADRFGARVTGLAGLTATLIPLLIGWKLAHDISAFYVVAVLLGIGGASFAVALPLASHWYPPEYQGLAMGIAGAGNSGTLFATLFAPRLATAFGWHNVFAAALIPVALVLFLFALMAKESPSSGKVIRGKDYAAALTQADTGWFCLFYSVTFGGFVGLSSYLTVFFHDQYGLSKVAAGDFTTLCVVAGSFLRPVGGTLADRIGGYRLLLVVLSVVTLCLLAVGTVPPLSVALVLLVVAMGSLGMGNGSVFQLVPQRFPERVGILTGIVGAAGGLGGFFLPSFLGLIKEKTGQFGPGLLVCGGIVFCVTAALLLVGHQWRSRWTEASVRRGGIFSYRGLRPAASEISMGD